MQNEERVKLWKAAVIGGAAGVANGLFGAGGGLILVPLLMGWLKLPERVSFATTMAVSVPISAVSLLVYMLHGGISPEFAWPYFVGGIVGGALAGLLFRRLPVIWLRRAMGIFLLYGGVKAVLLL